MCFGTEEVMVKSTFESIREKKGGQELSRSRNSEHGGPHIGMCVVFQKRTKRQLVWA